MKRKCVLSILILILFAYFSPFCKVLAQSAEKDAEVNFASDMYGLLGDVLSENAPSEDKSIADEISELLSLLDIKNIFSSFFESIKDFFIPSLKTHAGILALVILCSVISVMKSSLPSACNIAGYIGLLCLGAYLFSIISSLCENLGAYITRLCAFMTSLLPVTYSLNCASVGEATALTQETSLALALGAVGTVSVKILLPLVRVCLVFGIISALSRFLDLSGLSSMIRSVSLFALGLAMTVFVAVLYFQNAIAKSADTIAARTVKYTVQSFIPLVGNLIGESMKTVTTGISTVKTVTGGFGIAAIIYLFLPPFAAILVNKFFVLLGAALAKILGAKSESALLYEMNGCINLLNAVMLMFTSVFIIILAIFVKAAA